MAPVLYFLAGVLAGASVTLTGYTAAAALARRSARLGGAAALLTLTVVLAPLVLNRPRYVGLGSLLGAFVGLVLLGLGKAAGDTSRSLEQAPMPPVGHDGERARIAFAPTVHDCPVCGADALACETTGEARRDRPGYHRRCPNGHEWDDPAWSYIRADALRAARRQLRRSAASAESWRER